MGNSDCVVVAGLVRQYSILFHYIYIRLMNNDQPRCLSTSSQIFSTILLNSNHRSPFSQKDPSPQTVEKVPLSFWPPGRHKNFGPYVCLTGWKIMKSGVIWMVDIPEAMYVRQ